MRFVTMFVLAVGMLALVGVADAAQVQTPIRVGGQIQPPLKIKDVAPVMPQMAIDANVSGIVIIEATIGTDGTVSNATVLRHVPLLDQAAIDAVLQWAYRPTMINGAAVPIVMTVTVTFPPGASPPSPSVPPIGPGPSMLTIVRVVKPGFPPDALSAGLSGTVSLEVSVDATGRVTNIVVAHRVPAFDSVSVDAVRQWIFSPPRTDGVPSPSRVAIDFVFTPQGEVRDSIRLMTPAPGASGAPPVTQAPPGTPPLRIGGSVPPPAKIVNVMPVYPAEAQQARVTGVVIIEITIAPDGTVSDARVLRSIPLLDQAALDAVTQWRFAPSILDGVAMPIVMTVTVNFMF